MTPKPAAPRRSPRLTQKRDGVYKRETSAGHSARQYQADQVLVSSGNALSIPTSKPYIHFQDQTAHEQLDGPSRKRRKLRESPDGHESINLASPSRFFGDQTTCKPPSKRHPPQRRRTETPNQCNGIDLASAPHLDNQPKRNIREEQDQTGDPVAYWVAYAHWPQHVPEMPPKSGRGSMKRSGSSSYTSSYRNGDVPAPHSAASEEQLLIHGVNLGMESARTHISKTDEELCNKMLSEPHQYVPNSGFPLAKLSYVLQEISRRGEGRIVRDISPLLVPSPENLVLLDVLTAQGIVEDVGEPWKAVPTMGGPMPRPDLTVGIRQSMFGENELAKLQNYKSWDRATLFTNYVYFPFLICEVKCSERPIDQAMRQGGHAGAIAANAVFQLIYTIGRDKAEKLNGTILSFTIAHNHRTAEILGCFPILKENEARPTFYQYSIYTAPFGQESSQVKRVRDFVLEIYTSWYPTHLKRIQDALKEMPIPSMQQMGADDQGSMPPPTTSASQMLQEQVAKSQEQVAKMAELLAERERLEAERERAGRNQVVELKAELLAERKKTEAERERAEQLRKAEREEAEQLRKAEREEAERLRKAEREEAERLRKAEREEAEKRHREQQDLLERLLANLVDKTR